MTRQEADDNQVTWLQEAKATLSHSQRMHISEAAELCALAAYDDVFNSTYEESLETMLDAKAQAIAHEAAVQAGSNTLIQFAVRGGSVEASRLLRRLRQRTESKREWIRIYRGGSPGLGKRS